jgi:hypothetical protein
MVTCVDRTATKVVTIQGDSRVLMSLTEFLMQPIFAPIMWIYKIYFYIYIHSQHTRHYTYLSNLIKIIMWNNQ